MSPTPLAAEAKVFYIVLTTAFSNRWRKNAFFYDTLLLTQITSMITLDTVQLVNRFYDRDCPWLPNDVKNETHYLYQLGLKAYAFGPFFRGYSR